MLRKQSNLNVFLCFLEEQKVTEIKIYKRKKRPPLYFRKNCFKIMAVNAFPARWSTMMKNIMLLFSS